ncbi:TetR/AcrR family transcriptional regulator [Streptococcus oricebi]|uniref:TetR/AcrR family transcriptional regulator n=1 Tax=Streptococcus oricebi TaxID=1547447 RepID=A0ABS5B1W5_9STRE|nr:TetR/AcrR family transcriptional regulator [Streptococcus oricebi]MBP2622760.1 TetR/AcrR family transcriptional regulator [Streptococcus oricebi]
MANKKEFILDKAQDLFVQQGFDKTSIVNILEATGIARGTLYYYFTSKEEIMDAIIERSLEQAFQKSSEFAQNKSLGIFDRLFGGLLALNLSRYQGPEIMAHLEAPQNALLYEKSNRILLERAPLILLPIIEDAITSKLMETDYPLESLEMLLTYSLQVFNQDFQRLSSKEQEERVEAFIYLVERVFQSQKGCFDGLKQILY